MRLAMKCGRDAADGLYYLIILSWRFVMETYSSSVAPVFVGGLVGHIFPAEPGRAVGGCVGVVRLSHPERRHVGGCVGYVYEPAIRRFVGGCVGAISLRAPLAHPAVDAGKRSHRETWPAWREDPVAEAAV
jgi:hypothetical protein